MKRTVIFAFAMAILAVVVYSPKNNQLAASSDVEQIQAAGQQKSGPTVKTLDMMPRAFTENRGQWDERVKFRANAGGATMWFTTEGVYYQFTRHISKDEESTDDPLQTPHDRFRHEPDSIEQLVIKASFIGANPNVEIVGEGLMEYKCNYFIGNDPSKWRTDVPNYASVLIKELYPGIDIRYFGTESGVAGYEFIGAPWADLSRIKVEYDGVDSIAVDESGTMVAYTGWGNMIAATGSPVDGSVSATSGLLLFPEKTVGFDVAGNETRHSVSLGVTLDYSTYLGGSSSDYGYGIAVDGSGAAYVAGFTFSSSFPTLNPYQETHQGGTYDGFVTKLASSGSSLIYSTYLGGSDYEHVEGIAVDGSGAAYVTGYTDSPDFPTLNPYQTDQGDRDVFITKLSSSGNSLVYSTYLGGSDYDQGFGIAVDGSGAAYVAGQTSSSSFPTLNPYQGTYQGYVDVIVTKLSSSGNSLVYSTYLGGSFWDFGYGIAVDGSGAAYVTGVTWSTDFPTLNPYQATHQGEGEVFVTKLSSSGNLVYSTYLGGNELEYGNGIAVDGSGAAYVTGGTYSTDFPTLNPYQTDQDTTDVFVTKLSSSGSSLVYSTYLGGSDYEYAQGGIAVDGSGAAYVTGITDSPDFPTLNPFQTDQGDRDVFITKLSSSGNSLDYSTYLGGSSWDNGVGIAVDGSGAAHVTGYTASNDFPTLNPYQTDQGGKDAFVTKLQSSDNETPYFIHLTDTHYGRVGARENVLILLQEITSWPHKPEFVLVTGDVLACGAVSGMGCPPFWPSWLCWAYDMPRNDYSLVESDFQVLIDNGIPYFVCPGNHDYYSLPGVSSNLNKFEQHFPSELESTLGDIYLLSVNSGSDEVVDILPRGKGLYDEQLASMSSKLDLLDGHVNGGDGSSFQKVLMMHHPAINFKKSWDEGTIFRNRNDFKDMCDDFTVDLVCAGHTHWGRTYSGWMDGMSGYEGGYSNYSYPLSTQGGPLHMMTSAAADGCYRRVEIYEDHLVVQQDERLGPNAAMNLAGGSSRHRMSDNIPGCPARLHVVNSLGHRVGLDDTLWLNYDIPGAVYSILPIGQTSNPDSASWDESCEAISIQLEQDDFTYEIFGVTDGTINLALEVVSSDGITISAYYDSIGVYTESFGELYVSADSIDLNLYFDDNGDSAIDRTIEPTSVYTSDFICGDADASGEVDIDDVVYLIAYIFSGGPEPLPYESGDADCSGAVDIDDVVWLINYIFSGGNAPCDTDGDGVPDC